MRLQDLILADIIRHGRFILDQVGQLDEREFIKRFAAEPSSFRSTICYSLIIIGEACNQLPSDNRVVEASPEVDWAGWIALRNVLAHAYFRIDPVLVWRALGEPEVMASVCDAGSA